LPVFALAWPVYCLNIALHRSYTARTGLCTALALPYTALALPSKLFHSLYHFKAKITAGTMEAPAFTIREAREGEALLISKIINDAYESDNWYKKKGFKRRTTPDG
jgi:zinc transporter ZupT